MRDIALTLLVAGLLPFILARPQLGLLAWHWISLMSPHRLTFGFAYSLPFAAVVGGTTLVGLALSREPKRLPLSAPLATLVVYLGWMALTSATALSPEEAWEGWRQFAKIVLFLLATAAAMQSRERITALVWVSTMSIGFYGIKGGLYTLRTAGGGMVLGPDGSFISGNTEIALALTMTVPLLWWLYQQTDRKWIRRGLLAAAGLTAIAVIGSYSRGGFLAIAAMSAFMWLKGRNKLLIGVLLALAAPAVALFMPEAWFAKMATIRTYDEDHSAMGRINAWQFAINLAAERPLVGGGIGAFAPDLFLRLAPDPYHYQDAHSIWFEVLGEQGYGGLVLFLLMWAFTWAAGGSIGRLARGRPDLAWAADLGRMVQVSLIGYWVGGSFLGLAYWDYPYLLMVLLVLTHEVAKRELATGRAGARDPHRGAAGSAAAGGRPLAPSR